MRRFLLASLAAAALIAAIPSGASAANVLIYGPSDDGFESTVATDAGHTVTVADDPTWAGMTTADFAAFDAIVIGFDQACADLAGAEANRTTWSPAVSEGIVVSSFDNHEDNGGPHQTAELVNNEINFAATGTGTGLYVGCARGGPGPVTLLDQFGTFEIDGESRDTITILDPSHPVIVGPPTLTEAGLSNWSNSTHSGFTTFPASFSAIAQGEEVSPEPVLLARTPPPPPAPAPAPLAPPSGTCRGLQATIVGTPGNDVRTGTPARDVMLGLGGNDNLSGLGGNDVICGGTGGDTLKGGKGKDTLLGQKGSDKLKGGGGKDKLSGKKGKDTLKGGGGKDKLKGGGGKDRCIGGKANDSASKCEVEKSI
jgi:Ca2+-binding RTX toxin-like protein